MSWSSNTIVSLSRDNFDWILLHAKLIEDSCFGLKKKLIEDSSTNLFGERMVKDDMQFHMGNHKCYK